MNTKLAPPLKHPRRIRDHGTLRRPDGTLIRCSGYRIATPEQEEWYGIHDPEHGLHPEDLAAYRRAQRGPVARFLAALVFWRQ